MLPKAIAETGTDAFHRGSIHLHLTHFLCVRGTGGAQHGDSPDAHSLSAPAAISSRRSLAASKVVALRKMPT